jgi:formamidopyrimidine-DNA glycosylase
LPELPEVETVRRGLAPAMTGATIAHADIRRADLRWPFPENMAARLTGAQVLALRRRSKYILVDLNTAESLIIHLGMSGRMTVSGFAAAFVPGDFHFTHPELEKHDHVVLDLSNGARITFNDPRRFGAMDLAATATLDAHKLMAGIGPEPLGNAFDETYLVERLKTRRSPIKTALLDQTLVAGLGNIYVCEVLFRAGIAPTLLANSLPPGRVASLVPIIRDVLSEAITAGGSSLRDYRQADGELGYFQHRFTVYGREDEPCVTPGCSATVQRIVQAGRSTYWCDRCQD